MLGTKLGSDKHKPMHIAAVTEPIRQAHSCLTPSPPVASKSNIPPLLLSRSVACGGWHTVAVAVSGLVYVYGRGEYGRLGLGKDKTAMAPRLVQKPKRDDDAAHAHERVAVDTPICYTPARLTHR